MTRLKAEGTSALTGLRAVGARFYRAGHWRRRLTGLRQECRGGGGGEGEGERQQPATGAEGGAGRAPRV